MENKDKPAMPFTYRTEYQDQYTGLTKREHFASMALQGLLSKNMPSVTIREKSAIAVEYADALLLELDK